MARDAEENYHDTVSVAAGKDGDVFVKAGDTVTLLTESEANTLAHELVVELGIHAGELYVE